MESNLNFREVIRSCVKEENCAGCPLNGGELDCLITLMKHANEMLDEREKEIIHKDERILKLQTELVKLSAVAERLRMHLALAEENIRSLIEQNVALQGWNTVQEGDAE